MAVTSPVLDLLLIDTHSCYSMGIADFSQYPSGFNIVSPTIQITVPSGGYVVLTFTAQSVNIYNSTSLGFTCEDEDLQALPDGIYQFKYTINPASTYYVEKTFLRVDALQEKYDNAFLKLDLDCMSSEEDKRALFDISLYIAEAIAAANKCALDLAMKMYRKASKLLDEFVNSNCNCK